MATYVKGNPVENATSYELFEKFGSVYNSLKTGSEINFDVSALGLSAGNHTLVVKAKADGYEDSDYSNEVVYAVEDNGIDSDASAFIAAASITDEETTGKLNTLVKSLKANNLWDKIDALYPCVGSTFEQMSYNLKDPTTFQMRSLTGKTPEVDETGIITTTVPVVCDNYTTAPGEDFHALGWTKTGYLLHDTLTIALSGIDIATGDSTDYGFQIQWYDNGTEPQVQVRTHGKNGRWNLKPCSVDPAGLTIASLTSGIAHNGVNIGTVKEGTPQLTKVSVPICLNGMVAGTTVRYPAHRGLIGFGKGLTMDEMITYSTILNEFKGIY